jgi:hypothetical protein
MEFLPTGGFQVFTFLTVVAVQMNVCGRHVQSSNHVNPVVSIIISLAIAGFALWVALREMGRKDVG